MKPDEMAELLIRLDERTEQIIENQKSMRCHTHTEKIQTLESNQGKMFKFVVAGVIGFVALIGKSIWGLIAK